MTYSEELALELNSKLPKEYSVAFEINKVFIKIPDNYPFGQSTKELHRRIDIIERYVKSKPQKVVFVFTNYSKTESRNLTLNIV